LRFEKFSTMRRARKGMELLWVWRTLVQTGHIIHSVHRDTGPSAHAGACTNNVLETFVAQEIYGRLHIPAERDPARFGPTPAIRFAVTAHIESERREASLSHFVGKM